MKQILLLIIFNFVFCLEIGNTPVNFYLRDLNNEDYFLSDELKNNSPILISFFSTSCAPCRMELPQLDSLSVLYKDINFIYIVYVYICSFCKIFNIIEISFIVIVVLL